MDALGALAAVKLLRKRPTQARRIHAFVSGVQISRGEPMPSLHRVGGRAAVVENEHLLRHCIARGSGRFEFSLPYGWWRRSPPRRMPRPRILRTPRETRRRARPVMPT